MCGIAGWLGFLKDREVHGAAMAEALHHRGPDARGIRSWPEAALVHTRLSIIDLSPTGAQPMSNEDGTVWTVFNGEVYNHKELRRDLELRGHIFKGHSDTEVLPHLYEEYGHEFLTKLRGMFALAIYDARKQKLLLARDRFGIKPLFYSPSSKRLAFASEIRALLELPGVDDRPDRQAIYDFAALFFIPAPETFYRGIRALQPGEMIEAELHGAEISWRASLYHRWTIAPDDSMTLGEALERADALVTAAVRRQLESDVPLGALLSGGIDSSLVSAAAQTALEGNLRTFNVRFADREYDETWAALATARHIGSRHDTLDMDGVRGSWDHITGVLRHAGQPFADTSLFPSNTICRLMKQKVTVALSGDGGDEAFGGYNSYWKIGSVLRWQTMPPAIWHAASLAAAPLARFGAVPGPLPERLRDLAAADHRSILQNLLCWVRDREHHTLSRDTKLLPVSRFFEPQWEHRPPASASPLERLSMLATEVNVRLIMPNDYLFKVDTASMKESMEIRVPMLDEDLFEFGLSLPHRLKVKGKTCKLVLRGIAERRLPATVANKRKRGFEIPIDSWVDSDFKVALRETLLGPSSRLPEYFCREMYGPLVEAFCNGKHATGISRDGLYRRAIMLLSLHLALERKSDRFHSATPATLSLTAENL